MAKKIYLEGGGDIRKGENDKLDKDALSKTKNKKVYVIDLTSNDPEKVAQYREFFKQYFKRIGAKEVNFISTSESLSEIREQLDEAGIVYIPGGDTEVLLENIKDRRLENYIKNTNGILVGNSAGAMVLCRESICALEKYEKRGMLKGIGLLDLIIDVHYTEKHDKTLSNLSKNKDIYAIPEKGAIIWSNGKLKFIGNVYLFSKGRKEEVI